jgi:hypothetical protein
MHSNCVPLSWRKLGAGSRVMTLCAIHRPQTRTFNKQLPLFLGWFSRRNSLNADAKSESKKQQSRHSA